MGVLFMDSFDHYTTLPGKWSTVLGNAGGMAIGGSYARYGAGGLRLGSAAAWDGLRINFPAYYGTLYAGFGMRMSGATGWIYYFHFGSSSYPQVLAYGSLGGGFMGFWRDSTSNYLTGFSYPFQSGVWFHIEIKVVFHSSTGQIVVKINGTEVVNTSSLNTGSACNSFAFGWTGTGGTGVTDRDYDDLWIADDAFYGDTRIQCISPTGAGNYAQWVPSAGNNWDCVEEKPPVTTDYVSSGTAGQIDTYVTENVTPTTGTVVAVAGNFYAQKSDAGSRSIAIATRLGGTDDAGSGIALPSSWGYLQDIKATKPGGGAWAIADVNNAEFGVKMIA